MHNYSFHKVYPFGYRNHFSIARQDGEKFIHYAHSFSLAYMHSEKKKKNSTFGINIGEEFYTVRMVEFSREDQFNYELSGEGLDAFDDYEFDELKSERQGVAFYHFLHKYEDTRNYATACSMPPSCIAVYGALVDTRTVERLLRENIKT